MQKTPLKYIWHYVRQFKLFMISMAVLIIGSQLCAQIYPLYLAKIYNTAAGEIGQPDYWHRIIHFTLVAFAFGLGQVLLFESTMFLSSRVMPKLRTIVIRDSFDYVNKHSIAYFNQEMSGNISNKVNQLNSGVLEALVEFFNAFNSGVTLVLTAVILGVISGYFLIAVIVWLVATIYISRLMGIKRSKMSKETSRQQSLANGVIVDSIANYSEIKSFANFSFERLNLLKYLRILREAETKEQKIKARIHLFQNLFATFSVLGFMFLSIWIFRSGYIDTTQFIYSNTLFAMVSMMVFHITWSYNNIMRTHGQLNSALETLAVEPEIVDCPGAVDLKAEKAAIVFENVSFAYKGRPLLFDNINVSVRPGEKIGLVGHSGAGKSTFVKLLARYFDISSGAIKINGIDIREITQDSLHRLISTIPQDVCLFNRTLFENIKYGRTNAAEEDVCQAAEKAGADVFIKAFPKAYMTKVGERGVVLSGGERQRIAIARAILKNAPILIFDEATSALDSESEKHIQKSLSALMKDKTVIAVAHRLSTLREMDRILVFDKGKIVEEGTHLGLLRKKGMYYKLYNMQADGFVGAAKL